VIRVLRLFLLIVATTFVVIAIPRESGRERAVRRIWTAPIPAHIHSVETPENAETLAIVGADFWSLIDPNTGLSPVSGLPVGRFAMFPDGFINQPPGSPRWVVQRWNGDVLRIVENTGVPRFFDDMLVQFGESDISVVPMPEGDPVSVPADVRLTAFTATNFPGSGRFVATGTARGGIVLYGVTDQTLLRLGEESIHDSRPEPVYALAIVPPGDDVADDQGAREPGLVALGGLEPQHLAFLAPENGLRLQTQRRVDIPAGAEVREPTDIVYLGESTVAVALRDSIVIWDTGADRLVRYEIDGARRIIGGSVDRNRTVVAVARDTGWVVLFTESGSEAPRIWSYTTGTVLAVDQGRVITRVGSDLIAIEVAM